MVGSLLHGDPVGVVEADGAAGFQVVHAELCAAGGLREIGLAAHGLST